MRVPGISTAKFRDIDTISFCQRKGFFRLLGLVTGIMKKLYRNLLCLTNSTLNDLHSFSFFVYSIKYFPILYVSVLINLIFS